MRDYDPKWEAARIQVWRRDRGACRIWNCLTPAEKGIIIGREGPPARWQPWRARLDIMHIIPRSHDMSDEMYYGLDNLLLGTGWIHECFENFMDPVTLERIDWDKRLAWHYRARDMMPTAPMWEEGLS